MSLVDLFRTAFHNLWTRKLRTTLNLVGIVIGSVLLLTTLAATEGIKQAVVRFVESSEHSRRFRIYPDYDRSIAPPDQAIKVEGDMTPRRRERIQLLLEEKWREKNQPRRYRLDPQVIEKLRLEADVVEVSPRYSTRCDVVKDQETETVNLRSFSSLDSSLRERIIVGDIRKTQSQNQILIHEGLAYELGFRGDDELNQLLGQKVRLRFRTNTNSFGLLGESFFQQSIEEQTRWFRLLESLVAGKSIGSLDPASQKLIKQFLAQQAAKPKTTKIELIEKTFIIGGVFRRTDDQDVQNALERFTGGFGDLLVHHQVFETELNGFLRQKGTYQADVYVENYSKLEPTIELTKSQSVRAISPTSIIKRIIDGVEKSRFTLTAIVLIVLFISAIGISNTMFISLIERREEIGIMKAVGGRNRDILWLILVEGVATGLLGGVAALTISVVISVGGNEILSRYVETRASIDLEGQIFQIEVWMIAATFLLSVLTTTLAGIWPAWRASRIDPVVAMGQR